MGDARKLHSAGEVEVVVAVVVAAAVVVVVVVLKHWELELTALSNWNQRLNQAAAAASCTSRAGRSKQNHLNPKTETLNPL
jgi:hypothetical protein